MTPGKRGKIVLSSQHVARLLGLPDDVRVVAMHVSPDPDLLYVRIEGDSLPDREIHEGGPSGAVSAWAGWSEAPYIWHPVQGAKDGKAAKVWWGAWRPGDDRPVEQTYWAAADGSEGEPG